MPYDTTLVAIISEDVVRPSGASLTLACVLDVRRGNASNPLIDNRSKTNDRCFSIESPRLTASGALASVAEIGHLAHNNSEAPRTCNVPTSANVHTWSSRRQGCRLMHTGTPERVALEVIRDFPGMPRDTNGSVLGHARKY